METAAILEACEILAKGHLNIIKAVEYACNNLGSMIVIGMFLCAVSIFMSAMAWREIYKVVEMLKKMEEK